MLCILIYQTSILFIIHKTVCYSFRYYLALIKQKYTIFRKFVYKTFYLDYPDVMYELAIFVSVQCYLNIYMAKSTHSLTH